jgi:hypothetical protein
MKAMIFTKNQLLKKGNNLWYTGIIMPLLGRLCMQAGKKSKNASLFINEDHKDHKVTRVTRGQTKLTVLINNI